MGNNCIPILLAAAIAAGSFEAYTQHEHVPEDFYPTTRVVEVDVAYITGSYVDFRRFPFDYGAPLSGSLA